MVIINSYISGDQIQHRNTKVLVRKQRCSGMVLWLLLVARPVVITEERIWSGWYCTKYQLGVHWATRIRDNDNFQRAKSAYCSQAAGSFLNCHFAEIATWNDQQWQPVTRRGQFSVQNSTLISCLSSFLSFEPSLWLPDPQSQSGSHSSRHPINGSKFPAKSSLGA